MGGPAAHDADVADVRGEGADQRRHVEFRVVRQHAHGVARSERGPAVVEHGGRPGDEDLVGHREAAPSGEHLSGVADRHPVPEHLGDASQGGGEVDRTEDPHLRRRSVRLDEHPHRRLIEQILRRRLSFRSVVADAGCRRFELGEGVSADDAVEFGMSERSEDRSVRFDQQFGTDVRPVDDRRQGDGTVGTQCVREPLERAGHQSSSSMYRWIVPPHVRPTAKASSSE